MWIVSKGKTKQFSSFKWREIRAKCEPNDIKIAIFPQNYNTFQTITQSLLRRMVPSLDPPPVTRLSYISFFTAPPHFNTYFESINFWLKSSPFATSCLRTNLGPRHMINYPF